MGFADAPGKFFLGLGQDGRAGKLQNGQDGTVRECGEAFRALLRFLQVIQPHDTGAPFALHNFAQCIHGALQAVERQRDTPLHQRLGADTQRELCDETENTLRANQQILDAGAHSAAGQGAYRQTAAIG